MKNFKFFIPLVILTIMSCKNERNEEQIIITEDPEEIAYNSFGNLIQPENSLTAIQMEERYQNLSPGDTVEVKFITTVNAVCKNKGCWMQANLPEEEDVMVKFKEYSFFVPKDIEEKEVVMSGKAFVEEVSVEEQRHLAEDAGRTPEEIAAINEPKRTLSFVADGVLIKK